MEDELTVKLRNIALDVNNSKEIFRIQGPRGTVEKSDLGVGLVTG